MKATAHSRYVRVTPQKARRVMNEVRGLSANRALDLLKFAPQKPAVPIRKALVSALANAEQAAHNAGKSFDVDEMFVVEAYVNDGPTMKRFRARAQGRGARILKRTSHLTVVVGDAEDKREIASPWKKEVRTSKTVAAERAEAKAAAAKTAKKPAAAKDDAEESAPKTAAKKPAAKTTSTKSAAAKKTPAKTAEKATEKTTETKAATAKKAPAKTAAKDDAEKGAK